MPAAVAKAEELLPPEALPELEELPERAELPEPEEWVPEALGALEVAGPSAATVAAEEHSVLTAVAELRSAVGSAAALGELAPKVRFVVVVVCLADPLAVASAEVVSVFVAEASLSAAAVPASAADWVVAKEVFAPMALLTEAFVQAGSVFVLAADNCFLARLRSAESRPAVAQVVGQVGAPVDSARALPVPDVAHCQWAEEASRCQVARQAFVAVALDFRCQAGFAEVVFRALHPGPVVV